MSESALLNAARDEIRSTAEIADHECDIELREWAPSVAPAQYIVVGFGGREAGPTHDTAGGVIDLLYGIDVAIVLRSTKKPRDRTREMWTGFRGVTALTLASFDQLQAVIEPKLDFSYDLLNAANVYITAAETVNLATADGDNMIAANGDNLIVAGEVADGGEPEGFIEPLKFAGADDIREVEGSFFAARGERTALVRRLRFRGARRIQTRVAI